MPCLRLQFVALQGIDIEMRTPCLLLTDVTVACQCLPWSQFQLLPPFALDGNLGETSKVLSHVEYQYGVVPYCIFYGISLHDSYGLSYLLA